MKLYNFGNFHYARLTLSPPEDVVRKQVRRSMSGKAEAVKRIICKEYRAKTGIHVRHHLYELHHIVPIFWGGTNSRDNLSACLPWLHKNIHDFINSQVCEPEVGKQYVVLIPFLPNINIWPEPKP